MVELPGETAEVRPLAFIVAVAAEKEVQLTCEVRSCEDPSVMNPIAWNCREVECATVGLDGDTAIAIRAGAETVSVTEFEIEPEVAEIVVVPAATQVTMPVESIVATLVLDEAQVTVPLMSCIVPSVSVAVAVNCCVLPVATVGAAGVMAILCTCGSEIVAVT